MTDPTATDPVPPVADDDVPPGWRIVRASIPADARPGMPTITTMREALTLIGQTPFVMGHRYGGRGSRARIVEVHPYSDNGQRFLMVGLAVEDPEAALWLSSTLGPTPTFTLLQTAWDADGRMGDVHPPAGWVRGQRATGALPPVQRDPADEPEPAVVPASADLAMPFAEAAALRRRLADAERQLEEMRAAVSEMKPAPADPAEALARAVADLLVQPLRVFARDSAGEALHLAAARAAARAGAEREEGRVEAAEAFHETATYLAAVAAGNQPLPAVQPLPEAAPDPGSLPETLRRASERAETVPEHARPVVVAPPPVERPDPWPDAPPCCFHGRCTRNMVCEKETRRDANATPASPETRAGADPEDLAGQAEGDTAVVPTPVQWRARFLLAERERQLQIAAWVLSTQAEAGRCFLASHDRTIAVLTERAERAEAEVDAFRSPDRVADLIRGNVRGEPMDDVQRQMLRHSLWGDGGNGASTDDAYRLGVEDGIRFAIGQQP